MFALHLFPQVSCVCAVVTQVGILADSHTVKQSDPFFISSIRAVTVY